MNEIHCETLFPLGEIPPVVGPREVYDPPLVVPSEQEIEEERENYRRIYQSQHPCLDSKGEDYLAKLIRENDPTSMNLYMLTEHYDVNWETFKSRYPSEASIYEAWSNCDMLLI